MVIKVSLLSMLGATMLSASSYGMHAKVREKASESERAELFEPDMLPIDDIEELQELDAATVKQIIIDKEKESSASDESPALRIAALHSRELLNWAFARNPEVKIDAVDPNVGWTALHAACSWGQAESVKWLLEKGAQIEALDPRGMTPFLIAVSSGHADVVKLLVLNKALVGVTDETQATALHSAACNGNASLVALLIESGVPVNAQNESGITALHIACYKGLKDVVKVLLAQAAQTDLVDDEGLTALHFSAAKNFTDVVEMLLAYNLQLLDRQRKDGSTALHLAAAAGHLSMVELLLARGARIDLLDNQRKTPVQRAGNRFEVFTLFWNKEKADTLKKFMGI